MKILLVGDIVGSPGRRVFREVVKRLRAESAVHAVVVNAENAAAGNGITLALAEEIFTAGADVITMGDHVWGQRELEATIGGEKRLVRPVNFPPGTPGQGYATVQTALGPVTVVNLLGRVFMNPSDCPFRAMDALLAKPPEGVKAVVVDFHAEATSEKMAMGRYLDGRVAAVVGTHTHVGTIDARLLSGGTAYVTDIGMVGPQDSVIGDDPEAVIQRFLTQIPGRLSVGKGLVEFNAVLIDICERSGLASAIERLQLVVDPAG